ncbi:SRPBCC family protein [Methanoculleus sp. Wushi-C6]|uniref:SRPBCC family protein n=1 Tax=Methanoculleus caldifontis TaxID=2651577 RepID=A0ABU3X1J1_9EURY|nr:SRPBCC family protein [Methanoculleus sp. Wushi-C6]MDV2481901.1 SRPBCC family protein [Methanoculleus sp. Wushi-C6]
MAETQFTAEAGRQDIIITREFDAPRDLVFRACTEPDLVAQWWGPKGTTTAVEKMDAKPGGTWRVVQRDTEGNTFAMHGVFHDVTSERIVDTVEYEGMPGHVVLETETLEDLGGGRTKMTDHLVFQSVEDRDAMLQQDMKEGMVGTLDLLAGVLENLKTQKQAAPAR